MNPAPDAELISVGAFYHNWITNAVTDLVFKRLAEARTTQQHRWDAFLNPAPVQTEAVASASEQTNRTVKPGPITGGKKQSAKAAAASEPGATTSTVSSADSSGGKNTAPNSLANDEPKQRTNRRVKSETGTTSETKKSASSSRPKTIS
jgi:hypothetical protein